MYALTTDPIHKRETEPRGFYAAGSVRKEALVGISPVDGTELPKVSVSALSAVRKTVNRIRSAQMVWASLPLATRTKRLKKAAKHMLRDRDTVLKLIHRESGKSQVEALFSEALGPLDQVNGWAKIVARETRTKRVLLNPLAFPFKRGYSSLTPRGVIGVIAPWNYPLATFFRSVFPALLAGNAVIVKPSEYTPRVANWFVSHLQADLSHDVLDIVHGRGEMGRELIDAGIDACIFTGSVATGREVVAQCAKSMIPVSVELGGKDSAIVLADCDLSRTVAGLTHWALHNAGQSCGAIEVALVDERIADRFVGRLCNAWKRLGTRADYAELYHVAPLTHVYQLEVVQAHVHDAKRKGAVVLCGGSRNEPGLHFEPTVLDYCNETMDIVREETFGPVLPIVRVSGIDQALRITNSCRYGLTASIWTQDIQRAERIADRLDVGTVTINNHSLTGAISELPWSGTRDSGYGIANSKYALHTYMRPRSVLIDSSAIPDPYWMPFDDALWQLGNVLADLQVGRIKDVWKLPTLLYQRISRTKNFYNM